jgi:hypothetical protein
MELCYVVDITPSSTNAPGGSRWTTAFQSSEGPTARLTPCTDGRPRFRPPELDPPTGQYLGDVLLLSSPSMTLVPLPLESEVEGESGIDLRHQG